MTELAKHAPQNVTLASDNEVRPAPTVLEIIAAVARDPHTDVAKLEQLLALQERIQAKEAEIQFSVAMKAAQDEMPTVYRESKNDSNQSRYTKLEKLDAAIRPVYTKHGFSLSFSGVEPWDKGKVRVKCVVRHTGGHSEPHELEGDSDTAGPKGGATKTLIQGMGSTVSYLRRYLTLMIFNVMLSNEDNDGQKVGWITELQANGLLTLIQQCATPRQTAEEIQSQFLGHMGAKTLGEIHARDYRKALTALEGRLQALRDKAAQRAQIQAVDKLPDPIEPTLGTKMRCKDKLYEIYADAEGIQRWRETK